VTIRGELVDPGCPRARLLVAELHAEAIDKWWAVEAAFGVWLWTRPFVWPTRASSWSQISSGVVSGTPSLFESHDPHVLAGMARLALMWEKPIFLRSFPDVARGTRR
jgi:hypothetical protein